MTDIACRQCIDSFCPHFSVFKTNVERVKFFEKSILFLEYFLLPLPFVKK